MAEKSSGYENPGARGVEGGGGGHGGTAVKQGVRGGSTRAERRGRDEFKGDGASAALDTGRTEEAGRHYGRSGPESPGPGYGRGPLQPAEGTVAHPENDGVDFDELASPDAAEPPERSQGRHGGAPFAQGRDAGERKQMLPEDRAKVDAHARGARR